MGIITLYRAIDAAKAQEISKLSQSDAEAWLTQQIWDQDKDDEWELDLLKSALKLHVCLTGEASDGVGKNYPWNKCFFGERVLCNTEVYGSLLLPDEVKDVAAALENVNRAWFKDLYFQNKPWRHNRFRLTKLGLSNLWGLWTSRVKVLEPEQPAAEEAEEEIDWLFERVLDMRDFFRRCAQENRAVVFTQH